MKNSEIKVLEDLLKQEDVKGKKLIKGVLWLNTVEPKFKVGDAVKVTDRDTKICGQRVNGWNARITDISRFWTEKLIVYTAEITFTVNGEKRTAHVSAREANVMPSNSADSGKAFQRKDGMTYIECIEVSI